MKVQRIIVLLISLMIMFMARVTDINDPEGGTWNYSRTVDSDGNVTTTVLTGEGNSTIYVDRTESTGASTTVKTGP
ncbi:MAG: hypothetical protein ACYSWS_11395, partial [Planctomycetota bacterium]